MAGSKFSIYHRMWPPHSHTLYCWLSSRKAPKLSAPPPPVTHALLFAIWMRQWASMMMTAPPPPVCPALTRPCLPSG